MKKKIRKKKRIEKKKKILWPKRIIRKKINSVAETYHIP